MTFHQQDDDDSVELSRLQMIVTECYLALQGKAPWKDLPDTPGICREVKRVMERNEKLEEIVKAASKIPAAGPCDWTDRVYLSGLIACLDKP